MMFEPIPNSDKFYQIKFTDEQIQKIRKFITFEVLGEKDGEFVVTCEDDHTATFPNIKDYYSPEEINDVDDDVDNLSDDPDQ